ncbi:MAG: non-canonical purine NTP diphosphatase [Candidatus Cyclobacteriaceae bacterium M2_1C_046]
MEICFATNNKNKLREVREIVSDHLRILSLSDIGCSEELPEEQLTLEGNSHQKAEYVYKNYDISCFADDTGLEVFALDGAPGVRSARYAGEHKSNEDNINLLFENLKGKENRHAQFRTVITLLTPHVMKQFEGIVKGKIAEERRGEKGFGYDPVFIPEHYEKTFAEMTAEEKNKISHRAIAVSKLADYLKRKLIK